MSFLENILLEPFNFEGHGFVKAQLVKDDVNLRYEVNYMQYHDYMVGYVKG